MAYTILTVSVLGVALLVVPQMLGDFIAYQLSLFLIYGLVAQGIGLLWGKTDILPLGQALFFGGSAYATAFTLKYVDGGIGVQVLLIGVTIVVVALIAFTLAALVFRGRSDSGAYFAMITLALVMMAELVASSASWLTGGFNGLGGYESIANLDPFTNFYYLVVGVTLCVTLALLLLNNLPANLLLQAVADNERRLQLLGFRTHIIKGFAFAGSAALAAVAGSLFASHQGIVTPTDSGFALSAELLIVTAVGGRFHVLGPLLGAVVVGWATVELRDTFPYWELLMAVLFIAVVLRAPSGLAELIQHAWQRWFPPAEAKIEKTIKAPPISFSANARPLKFDRVRSRSGVINILNGVSFETPSDGIVSLIGPNGAGKTSVLNVVTGDLAAAEGHVVFDQKVISNRATFEALPNGIGRKLQVPSVFFSMRGIDNLTLAMLAGRARWVDYFRRAPYQWRSAALEHLLSHPSMPLQELLSQPVKDLPQGHRQFLEYAITIAAEPPVLLLDEPCAGLSPDETALMTELISEYQQSLCGLVVVVEHDMKIVEAISNLIIVLHQGRVLAIDTFAGIQVNREVQSIYSGGTK